MLPDKKIIAFDVDGTLTPSKSPITFEMAFLLKELVKKIPVIAISGGRFEQFKTQLLPLIENDESFVPFLHNLILLPTSGSQRYEYDVVKKDWELIDKTPLDENIKIKVKKVLQEIIDSGLYDIPPSPQGEIIEDRDTQITFSALGQKASIADKKAWDKDQAKRKKIKEAIEPKLSDVNILINAYSSIDILPKGFNKAVGLELLLKNLGLQKTDLVFVGDGLFPGGNDYSVKENGFTALPVKGPEDTEVIIREWIG